MKKTVGDASPLIFLAKIGQINLLSNYEVFVPRQVFSEILKGRERGKQETEHLIRFLEESSIQIVECGVRTDLPAALGEGEKAVISYAAEHEITEVWLDEARARTVARIYQLVPKGTLGILWDGFKEGRIRKEDLERQIFGLVENGYRISEEVLIKFLQRIRNPEE